MLRSIIEAFLSVLGGIVERLFRESRTASDADRDVHLLRRGGSRIAKWLHKSSVGAGKQPDSHRTQGPGNCVHPRKRQVDRK